jgi:hypothetical protein
MRMISVSVRFFLSLHEDEVNVLEIGAMNKVILETSIPLSESFIDSTVSKFLSANCSGNSHCNFRCTNIEFKTF